MTKQDILKALRVITDKYAPFRDNDVLVDRILDDLQQVMPARRGPTVHDNQSYEVLSYLNQLTGKQFQAPGMIPARMRDPHYPATVADCKLVLDWLMQHRSPEWIEDYMDQTTPFRKSNFERYLGAARQAKQYRWDRSRNGGVVL